MRRQLAGRITLDAGVLRRDYLDGVLKEVNGLYEGGAFRGYRDERINQILQYTSNRWNHPVYSGLELRVSKETSRLQLMAGYNRKWRHVEGTWVPNDPASFIQPSAFPNDRGIGPMPAFDSNSLSGSNSAFNVMWRDHGALLGVAHTGPWGLLLAGHYSFESGAWSGPVVTRIAAPDPRFGPSTVTLSNGRVVSNPLATTIRFVHPTRREGQFKGDDLHQLNLRIGRELGLGRQRLALTLDVLNVTNDDGGDLAFGANQTYNPAYRTTLVRRSPRSARLTARLSFVK